MNITRPASSEYAALYRPYVELVPDGAVFDILERQRKQTVSFASTIDEAAAGQRYAPGKWSVRQVFGHLADTERVMAYRMLCIARGDTTPLPTFDENAYVEAAAFDQRSIGDLIHEVDAVRQSTLVLLHSIDEPTSRREGVASGHNVSVRGLAYIIAGHELHHLGILRNRYKVGR